MAKVIMPGLGVSAHGTVGKCFVYEDWKGITRLRKWVRPKNPKSAGQTKARTYFMAASHLMGKISTDGDLASAVKAVMPVEVAWQAHYIGKIVGANAAAIEASLTAWDTAANSADWNSVALSLRVQPQLHPQAEIDEITAGEIVFLGARAAYRMGLDLAPVDAQDMTTGQIESFVAGFD